jgi:hypothetical protein
MVDHDITERARAERLRLIRDELRRRIRPVCPDMPDDLFMELVDTMSTVQLKYEMHEGMMPTSG